MRKFFILSLVALLLLGVSYSAFAQSSRVGQLRTEAMMVNSTAHVHVSTSPVAVYRVTITSDDVLKTAFQMFNSDDAGIAHSTTDAYVGSIQAPGSVGDNATTDLAFNRNCKADLRVAAANTTTIFNFTKTEGGPLRFDRGLLAGFAIGGDGAVAVIEYAALEN